MFCLLLKYICNAFIRQTLSIYLYIKYLVQKVFFFFRNYYKNVMIQVLVVLDIILESASCSVSNSLQPHGQQPTRLLCPCNSPDKNTAVDCSFLSPGDLPHSEIEPRSYALQADSLPSESRGKPFTILEIVADCTVFF